MQPRKEKRNILQKYKDRAFIKLYAKSLLNLLSEQPDADEQQKRRWVWELIQNACDSIAGDKIRKTVDVCIHIKKNSVEFSHNGTPFSPPQFLALVYKYSEGKERDNPETTGQFGTGFCSTHILSRTIRLESVITDKDDDGEFQFSDIKIVMYREGYDDEEIAKGVEKTQLSLEEIPKDDGSIEERYLTKFEYIFDPRQIDGPSPTTDLSGRKQSAVLGAKEFLDNICYVLCFNPKIGKASLIVDDDIDYFGKENEFLRNLKAEFQTTDVQELSPDSQLIVISKSISCS